MIEPLRRHIRAVLVGVVVALLVVPLVMLAPATVNAPGSPAAYGPLQELCLGPADPQLPAQFPVMGVVAEIHDGLDAAYVLIGGTPQGLLSVILCRTTDGGTFADSSGGTIGVPSNPLLTLLQGGSTSSEYPDRFYAGMVDPGVSRVVATQASGATVEAEVANAWYLIWTRTADNLVRITAFDATGAVVHTLEDANGLMPPR